MLNKHKVTGHSNYYLESKTHNINNYKLHCNMHSSIGVMGKVVYLKIDIAKNSLKWHLILFVTHNVLLQ